MNKDEILNKLRDLPPAAKYGAAGVAAVFVLAMVAGSMSPPAASPASVAPVAPVGGAAAVAPVAGATAQPAQPGYVAPPPPAAGAANGAAMVVPAASMVARAPVVLTPEQIASLKQCSAETVGARAERGSFSDLATFEVCDASMNIDLNFKEKKIPPAIGTVLGDSEYAFASKRAYIYADKAGSYTITGSAVSIIPDFSCEVYVGDLSQAALTLNGANASMLASSVTSSSVAKVSLEAGYHNVVTRCSNKRFGFGKPLAAEFSIRADSEAMPRALTGYIEKVKPTAPAAAPVPAAVPVAAPATAAPGTPVAAAAAVAAAPAPAVAAPAAPGTPVGAQAGGK